MGETETRRTPLRPQHRHQVVEQDAEVVSNEPVGGLYRRLGLRYTHEPFESHGFDDVVVLKFPAPGKSPHGPEHGSWHVREYTVVRVDPRHRVLHVDFLLHGSGVASSWAQAAQPGDLVKIIPTRMCRLLPEAERSFLFADSSAWPAARRFLQMAPGTSNELILHAQPAEELAAAALGIKTLPLSAAPQESVSLSGLSTLSGQPAAFVWIAGESGWASTLRRHLLEHTPLQREQIQFTGYWKST
ncbi:siderophore-interacting protein [Glutamicibacter sp. NPDC087344]|uniref:siderophore-interacting protein n=1 Tax=Glutamicibacter sp. NPDC087344 TaxID=3363994 RepID=UPI003808157F